MTRAIAGQALDEGSRLRERPRQGDNMVKITVEDTGEGIPENVLGKLFDPFFTTKAAGKGTGLGLTVARNIAELHGGKLAIMNRKDSVGAIATLTLKVAEATAIKPGNEDPIRLEFLPQRAQGTQS